MICDMIGAKRRFFSVSPRLSLFLLRNCYLYSIIALNPFSQKVLDHTIKDSLRTAETNHTACRPEEVRNGGDSSHI